MPPCLLRPPSPPPQPSAPCACAWATSGSPGSSRAQAPSSRAQAPISGRQESRSPAGVYCLPGLGAASLHCLCPTTFAPAGTAPLYDPLRGTGLQQGGSRGPRAKHLACGHRTAARSRARAHGLNPQVPRPETERSSENALCTLGRGAVVRRGRGSRRRTGWGPSGREEGLRGPASGFCASCCLHADHPPAPGRVV